MSKKKNDLQRYVEAAITLRIYAHHEADLEQMAEKMIRWLEKK